MVQFRRLLIMLVLVAFSFPTTSFALSLQGFFSMPSPNKSDNVTRIQAWQALIVDSKDDSEWQKLNKVNQFFNQIRFVEDKVQWGVDDYWASPLEFLSRNAGDCEDYSIAKYFTLKAMGVSVDRLRITYVMTLPSQQAHMVLVYLEAENKTPLVLDNLQKKIAPFIDRTDLDPIYSFNQNGLWLANRDSSQDQFVNASTQQVVQWQMLRAKMGDDRFL